MFTNGECVAVFWKTAVRIPRETITPLKLMTASFFLPVLSMKYTLTIEPNALKPEVRRERRIAVWFEAIPANWTIVGL